MKNSMSKKELMDKLKKIDLNNKDQRNSVVCSLIGHSRICTTYWGYRNCGRCGEQLGDNLGSIDPGITDAVIIGHKCNVCRKNYKKCDWRDKLYVPNPFKEGD